MNDRTCPFCGSEDVFAVEMPGWMFAGKCGLCNVLGPSATDRDAAVIAFTAPSAKINALTARMADRDRLIAEAYIEGARAFDATPELAGSDQTRHGRYVRAAAAWLSCLPTSPAQTE